MVPVARMATAASLLHAKMGGFLWTGWYLLRDGELVVGVVPVSGQLDLKALARALGGRRAVMADVTAAERATGYVAGGISPIGQRRRHRTVVDDTALAHPTVLVSAGRRGLDLEIAPADLVRVTGALVAAIAG